MPKKQREKFDYYQVESSDQLKFIKQGKSSCEVLVFNEGKWDRLNSSSPYPLWKHDDPTIITHRKYLKKLIEAGVASTKEVEVFHSMN